MVEVTELKKIPGHRVDFGVARKMSLGKLWPNNCQHCSYSGYVGHFLLESTSDPCRQHWEDEASLLCRSDGSGWGGVEDYCGRKWLLPSRIFLYKKITLRLPVVQSSSNI